MPNECDNDLQITGTRKELEGFYSENSKDNEKLLFSLSAPTKETGDNWLEKRMLYWGTKWEPMGVYSMGFYKDTTLYYSFITAWSPPINWLLNASEKYSNLSFSMGWDEEGEKIDGSMSVKNGNIIQFRKFKPTKDQINLMMKFSEKLETLTCETEWQREIVNYIKAKLKKAKNDLTRYYYIYTFITRAVGTMNIPLGEHEIKYLLRI